MKYVYLTTILTLLSIMSASSFGATFNKSGLTDEQVIQLEKAAAELQLNSQKSTTETVSEWVSIGGQLGKGLSSCAKELGVEVNNFVQTPVGKITAFVIIYKIIGRDCVHYGFGLLFLFIAIPLWIYFFRRMCVIKSVLYGELATKIGVGKKMVEFYKEGDCDGTRAVMLVVLIGLIITNLIVMFS